MNLYGLVLKFKMDMADGFQAGGRGVSIFNLCFSYDHMNEIPL